MAISNFGELKTAINEHVGETLTPVVDDLITMAQDHLSAELRHRRMIATPATLTVSSGEYTLPDNYQMFRRVVEIAGTRRRALKYITPEESDNLYPYRPGGLGVHFTTIGNKIRVFPTIATNDIELTYFADFAAFSADADTDWLLTKAPSLYLRVCQMMAAEYVKDDGEMAKHAVMADRMIDRLNSQSELAEYGNTEIVFSGNVA